MFPNSDDPLLPTAIAAAAVTALIEYPISQYYATIPETNTRKRMIIAGGMAFVSVLVGGAALKAYKKSKNG
jgi:hypothetical protein